MGSKVVFIHGYGGNSRDYLPQEHHLRKHGVDDFVRADYPHKFGEITITEQAEFLVKRLSEISGPFILVGYSQGGIIASTAVELLELQQVDCICTVCSPFEGSTWANKVPGPGAVDLRPNSDLLVDLEKLRKHSTTPYYGVWSPLDGVIIPAKSANNPYAKESLRVMCPTHALTFIYPKTVQFLTQVIQSYYKA